MRTPLHVSLLLPALLLAGGPLAAQEIRFGVQGTLALPTSDLADKAVLDDALGYGLGAHAVLAFPGGHAVVPRLDYTHFEKSSPTRKVDSLLVGADYNFFFSRHVNQGPYAGAGVGFAVARFKVDRPAASDDDTPNQAYGAVSGGWMFTPNLGAEVRYVYTKLKPTLFGTKAELTSPTVNASILYRF